MSGLRGPETTEATKLRNRRYEVHGMPSSTSTGPCWLQDFILFAVSCAGISVVRSTVLILDPRTSHGTVLFVVRAGADEPWFGAFHDDVTNAGTVSRAFKPQEDFIIHYDRTWT